jgi:hypothetical protein
VGPNHPRQLFGTLAFWQVGDVPFYTGEDYSICLFHRPIGLRVVDQSETQLGAQVGTEVLEVGTIKLLAIVHGDFMRHTEVAHDVPPEKLLYSRQSDAQQWLCFYPFGKILYHHHNVGVIPGCCW